MKKGILIVFAGLLLAVSCSKKGTGADEPTPTPTPTPEKKACVTGEYSNLGAKSVTLFGWSNEKEEEGLYAVYGFEYSDSDLTTAASTVTAKSRSKDSSNKYSCDLTGLTPGTKYYYRAYSRFNGITSYGDVKTFTTTTIEASVTADSSNVSYYTATISGKLTVESKGTFTKSAVLYYSRTASTLEDLKSSGTKKTLTLGTDDSYSIDLTSLARNVQYNYAVVAKVDDDEFDTGVKSFKTLEIEASVSADSSNVSYRTATISGKLTVESKGTFTKSAVLYYSSTLSTLEDLKSSGTKKTLTLGSDCSYSIDLTSLARNVQYNYAVVAKVDDAEFDTGVKSFKTLEIVSSVTAEASNVLYYSATISGRLKVESEGTFTKSAVLYYSSTASTLESLKSSVFEKTLTLDPDGSYSVVIESLNDKTKYYYVVVAMVDDTEFASEVKSFTTVSSLVDLGLSVKWATCNLGASKPEEYGGYYQWAGAQDVTNTDNNLDWSNCPYHTGSDEYTGWTKYVPSNKASYWSGSGSPDHKWVLDLEDDVAHVRLGGKWRMPTDDEWDELLNNCTSEWTTLNGVIGRKFTSKKNGNSIFLPAAGYRNDRYLDFAGSGLYWSSSLSAGPPCCACSMYFYSDNVSRYSGDYRCSGLSVRPVAE